MKKNIVICRKTNSFCKTSYITNSLLLWQLYHIYDHFTLPWSVYNVAITVFTKVMMMQKENLVSSSHWYSRGAGGITCRAIILFAPTTPLPTHPPPLPASLARYLPLWSSWRHQSVLPCHPRGREQWGITRRVFFKRRRVSWGPESESAKERGVRGERGLEEWEGGGEWATCCASSLVGRSRGDGSSRRQGWGRETGLLAEWASTPCPATSCCSTAATWLSRSG